MAKKLNRKAARQARKDLIEAAALKAGAQPAAPVTAPAPKGSRRGRPVLGGPSSLPPAAEANLPAIEVPPPAAPAVKAKRGAPKATAAPAVAKPESMQACTFRMVREGKTNAEILAVLQAAPHHLPDNHKHYPGWWRAALCRKLEASADPAERALAETLRAKRGQAQRADVHPPPVAAAG